MAMRMMLLRNVLGASTYHYHTEQTIKTLRSTARGETLFQIREPEKLKNFASRLGLATKGDARDIALNLCDFAEADFNRKHDEQSRIVEALAPSERKSRWRNLGIFPGGIHGEILRATSSCLTNVDGFYQSLALKAMRLGIAMAYQSQIINEYCQDVHSVAVAKELIKRDILILSMGCGNGAMQVAGLCRPEAAELAGPGLKKICSALKIPPVLSFGTCTDTGRLADLLLAISSALGDVPIPDLPAAAVAPEYMEQKATIDAIFALALGLFTYVNPVPTITGGPNLMRLLTQDCPAITGGKIYLEKDPSKAAQGILNHIEAKRKNLGI
mgnify:CR=1 FL=1